MILQTLSEIDDPNTQDTSTQNIAQPQKEDTIKNKSTKNHSNVALSTSVASNTNKTIRPFIAEEQPALLIALREKALVLFEGLQTSEMKDLNVKLDLVINYLQYQVSIIDDILSK